jgi:hypothetical protein
VARARKSTRAEKAVTGFPPPVPPEDQPAEDVPPPIMPEDQTQRSAVWCAHCGSAEVVWVTTSPAANRLHFCAAHKPPEPVMEYAA